MSIVFPDHVTGYYIPNAGEFYEIFKSCQIYPSIPNLENPVVARNRELKYRYKDHKVVPKASKCKLEEFVTTQKVEKHPIENVEGISWCIIAYQYPPAHDQDRNYVAALDYAFLEKFDAVMIEPFNLSQKTEQWINIVSIIFNLFGAWLSVAALATIHASMTDPAPLFAGLISVFMLDKYQRYIMGDPVSSYRNLDLDSNDDMELMYRMSELWDIHTAFSTVVLKDERRERLRYRILKGLIAFQMGLGAYKYFFGVFLKAAFPDRPV